MFDYSGAFGSGVLAFTSDRSIDFHKGASSFANVFALTPEQKHWLEERGADDVIFPKQVHGDAVWIVTSKDEERRGAFLADAIVTSERGLAIAVRTADCLPVLVHDPVKHVVAAVHAGWKSTKLEIVKKTIHAMVREFGCQPKDFKAVLGPCIRRENYKVGPEFSTYFPAEVSNFPDGLHFDIAAANLRQLRETGVVEKHIYDSRLCTVGSNSKLFSYRKEGEAAGRLLNLIALV